MALHLIEHDAPHVRLPVFNIDRPLNPRMPEEYSLLQTLNKNFCCSVIGRPSSGKTSLVTSFFTSRKIFRGVFDKILIFMPAHSL